MVPSPPSPPPPRYFTEGRGNLSLDAVTALLQWREWYAWRPVKDIHGKWHWLETLYFRRRVFTQEGVNVFPPREYGTLLDVLKEE